MCQAPFDVFHSTENRRRVAPELPSGMCRTPFFSGSDHAVRRARTRKSIEIGTAGIASSAMRRSCASVRYGRNIMNRRTTMTLTAMALLCLAVSLPAGSAVAQQKQQVSFKVPAENIKFGVQQNVGVGDVPNHILRLFETHT